MKYAQIIMGSAGTGKSTYCKAIQDHCAAAGRTVRVINLDPAAEAFKYACSVDIRDLISVDDVMQEMGYGPNGALIFAMEYLLENETWLNDHLESFLEDDYLLFDCPGQVELYSHVPVLKRVSAMLQKHGFNVCGVYLVDALFVTDASKLISGNLMALSAMVHFELPHINVLSKCDLLEKGVLDRYLTPSGTALVSELNKSMGERFKYLNEALARVLDEYDMVSFVPLDISDEDSIETLLLQVDHTMQYGEDMEPKEPKDNDSGGNNDGTVPRDDEEEGGAGSGGYDDDDEGLSERLAQASRNASRAAVGLGMGMGGDDDGFYGVSSSRYASATGSSSGRGTNVDEVTSYFEESMKSLGHAGAGGMAKEGDDGLP